MKKALTLFIVFAMLIGGLTACAAKESAAIEPAAPETTAYRRQRQMCIRDRL